MEQLKLFDNKDSLQKKSVKIVRLDNFHAKHETDHLVNFKSLILSNEQMYPQIDKWLINKVIPGLKDEERIAYVGYSNEVPIISAVVKKGEVSKFCHLKIHEDYQDNNFGEMFFTLMTMEIRNFAKLIYFTLPENLWESEKLFFNSFGFEKVVKHHDQYRASESELKTSTYFRNLWSTIPNRVVKLKNIFSAGEYSLDNGILLSLKPKYADAILSGKKKVEIRTRFDKNLDGKVFSIYSSSPVRAIVGQAKISGIVKEHPALIWQKYSNSINCTKKEFDEYVSTNNEVYAIIIDHVKPFKVNVLLNQLNHLTKNELKPPMSYFKLENNNKWKDAISIATIMQNNFKTNTIII